MADAAHDLEAYAQLSVRLADPGADRPAILAAQGLDEARWEEIDDAWEARLSAAIEADDEASEGVPALVLAHAEAFVQAQRGLTENVLSFDRFLEAAREMKRANDMATVLRRLDLSFDAYLRAQSHWTKAMLEDESLALRFRRAMA